MVAPGARGLRPRAARPDAAAHGDVQRDHPTPQAADRRRARRGLAPPVRRPYARRVARPGLRHGAHGALEDRGWHDQEDRERQSAPGSRRETSERRRPDDRGDVRDFELSWEWKVTPGANSGVKYNVSEELSVAQAGAMTPAAVAQGAIAPNHSALGFEYQMLDDDRHPDGQLPTHRAGALYDLVAPNGAKHLRPVGEWNQSRVVFRGNHGEHWLNGEKVVEFELGTAHMDSALAASKYHSIPAFAERRKGHIVLQDHGDEVYFRSIKVRVL